jgi:hypothetical protein
MAMSLSAFSAMARMSAGSSSDNSTLISQGSRCRKRKANTAVVASPAGQNYYYYSNFLLGLTYKDLEENQ